MTVEIVRSQIKVSNCKYKLVEKWREEYIYIYIIPKKCKKFVHTQSLLFYVTICFTTTIFNMGYILY